MGRGVNSNGSTAILKGMSAPREDDGSTLVAPSLADTPRAQHALFVRELSGFECAADESRVELPSVWRAQQPFAPPAVLRCI